MTRGQRTRKEGKRRLELLHLPEADWPQTDRERFAAAFEQPHDIFSDEGSGSRLRARTRESIRFGYRRWLGWISARHPERLAASPETRATPDLIRGFAGHLRLTCAENTVASQVGKLHDALHHMYPEVDWAWLRHLKTRLERAVPKRARKPILLTSAQLIETSLGRLDQVDADYALLSPRSTRKQRQDLALRYRDGLLVAFATFLPLRRTNLADLMIGTTMIRGASCWSVRIPGERVKNGEAVAADLPSWIVERIDRFHSVYRPLILASHTHQGLWASAKGRPAGDTALYEAFQREVSLSLGIHLTLHDTRRISATTWAVHDPVNAAGAKDLLGDRSDRVFAEHYNLAGGIEASRDMAHIIARLKAGA